jgi:hypothetical protein
MKMLQIPFMLNREPESNNTDTTDSQSDKQNYRTMSSPEYANVFESIPVKREFHSNESDESDSHSHRRGPLEKKERKRK